MIIYVFRSSFIVDLNDPEYEKFPFDTLESKLSIEIANFKIGDTNYRFDVYHHPQAFSWKPDVNGL